jgi:prolipoprotein diacylglyceryltransferase
MNVQLKMGIALGCTALTVAALVIDGPAYFHAVSQSLHAPGRTRPSEPPLLIAATLSGLVAWLMVVIHQWRQRQIGWIVASFALSYIAVISYATLTLVRARRAVTDVPD